MQRKKPLRKRPKETIQSPLQSPPPPPKNEPALPAPPSGTANAEIKKTLRSRLSSMVQSASNELLPVTEQEPEDDMQKPPKSSRPGRRSHSLDPTTIDKKAQVDNDMTPKAGIRKGRRSMSVTRTESTPNQNPSSDQNIIIESLKPPKTKRRSGQNLNTEPPLPRSRTKQKRGNIKNLQTEMTLPRSRKKSVPKRHVSAPDSEPEKRSQKSQKVRGEDEKRTRKKSTPMRHSSEPTSQHVKQPLAVKAPEKIQDWKPVVRVPSRTNSLPAGKRISHDSSQKSEDPKDDGRYTLVRTKSFTRLTAMDDHQHRAPTRSLSLQAELKSRNSLLLDELRRRDNLIDVKFQSKTKSIEKKACAKSVEKQSSGSSDQPFESPQKNTRSSHLRKLNLPPPPSPQIMETPTKPPKRTDSTTKYPIPAVISVTSPAIPETDEDDLTLPTATETPDSSESSRSAEKQKRSGKIPQRSQSLDRRKLKKGLDQAQSKPKRGGRKATASKTDPLLDKGGKGDTIKSDVSTPSSQEPPRVPKRARSLDRRAIMKLGRGKESTKDMKETKGKKRNWLKKAK